MSQVFLNYLKENDWKEITNDWEYRKGSWIIFRDTSSWWMISSDSTPRIFDFPEPTDYTAGWTVNLIEHLCSLDDRTRSKLLARLGTALRKMGYKKKLLF